MNKLKEAYAQMAEDTDYLEEMVENSDLLGVDDLVDHD